jgi:hypothetical protein
MSYYIIDPVLPRSKGQHKLSREIYKIKKLYPLIVYFVRTGKTPLLLDFSGGTPLYSSQNPGAREHISIMVMKGVSLVCVAHFKDKHIFPKI